MQNIFSKNSKIDFKDLYHQKGLLMVNEDFLNFFKSSDLELFNSFTNLQNNKAFFSEKEEANILIEVAKVLELFLIELFGIQNENEKLKKLHEELSLIYQVKRDFIQRVISKKHSCKDVKNDKFKKIEELDFAKKFLANKEDQTLRDYAIWALYSKEGQKSHKNGTLFHLPQKIDFQNLVKFKNQYVQLGEPTGESLGQGVENNNLQLGEPSGEPASQAVKNKTQGAKIKSSTSELKDRDGFNLTDKGFDLSQTISEANYCIFCHNQGKDSCAKGLFEKKLQSQQLSEATAEPAGQAVKTNNQTQQLSEATAEPAGQAIKTNNQTQQLGEATAESRVQRVKLAAASADAEQKTFKKDFFGQELSGCPLEEKISEMNLLKTQGFSLGSLAIAVVDNPMIAATGHRICNDCMKSCIYQKQDPVDIPQIESRVLKDVLDLPYGFEIYSLLTRWNPLNLKIPIAKQDSGYKVLVAGLGPAGFTLAHYLMNEGHLVVGIDGLKIEPLDPQISGIDLDGNRCEFKAIKDVSEIYDSLDERPVYGFGGVAEYGITVRWDKNFLKVIRLLLERRKNFRMLGGVRLGSAFDCKDALNELDFDHVALCLGAGWPNTLNIKNNFVKGVRSASDFLMALQLTGAMHKDLVTNLQVRLPILVVGAGLTAIDTATESLAYYVQQVENFSKRYKILCDKIGKDLVEKDWNVNERQIAKEFLEHASQIKETKEKGESVTQLLQKLGGAKLVYRKKINEAPSYKTNHLEIQKALEEGIEIIDETTPVEIVKDEFNHICGLDITTRYSSEYKISKKTLPAKSLFVAIGTSPNKAPAYEDKLKFGVENNSFEVIDLNGKKIEQKFSPKAKDIGFLAARDENKKTVSFFGDTHTAFAGSVVKAMASAKNGFETINESLAVLPKNQNYQEFLNDVNEQFSVKVKELSILSNNVFELIVHAPLLAKKTKLGHIFRLHNYHASAVKKGETLLAMEGVALTTYKVDQSKGEIGVIIINAGGSSSIVKDLKIGENIIFMGPGGTPNHIAQNKEVVFLGAGRGVFPLASLAKAHKEQGCKVTLFCGFKKESDIVRLEELQESCDELIISIEEHSLQLGELNSESPGQGAKTNNQIQQLSEPSGESRGQREKTNNLFQGNLVEAFISFAKENKSQTTLDYSKIDLIFCMGNEDMMSKIASVRHNELKNELKKDHIGISSLNNPMQCMLKGVCSQCLQKKTDSKTGQDRYFYSCISQDQKSDEIDFEFLKNRCTQNSLQEKLTRDWISNLS